MTPQPLKKEKTTLRRKQSRLELGKKFLIRSNYQKLFKTLKSKNGIDLNPIALVNLMKTIHLLMTRPTNLWKMIKIYRSTKMTMTFILLNQKKRLWSMVRQCLKI